MCSKIGSRSNFYIPALSLRYIGVEIRGANLKQLHFRWWFWVLFLADLLRVCCAAADSLSHLPDLHVSTAIWTVFVQDCLTLWKAMVFVVSGQSMMNIVYELHAKTQEAKEDEIFIAAREMHKDFILTRAYFIACALTAVAGILAPVLSSIWLTVAHKNPIYILPFDGKFPFDPYQLYNYVIVVTISAVSMHFAINACVAVDAIYSWFVHSIAVQFQRLEIKLQAASSAVAVEETLEDCIHYHQWIIGVAQKFSSLFRPVIFVEFSLNSLQLCLVAFRLQLGFSSHSTPFLIIFFGAVIIQLIIYCYAGQKLKNESERIIFAVYDCIKLRKHCALVLLPLMRAQKPCQIDGIFFKVDFELFIWVVRTAASYLALLRSMK